MTKMNTLKDIGVEINLADQLVWLRLGIRKTSSVNFDNWQEKLEIIQSTYERLYEITKK